MSALSGGHCACGRRAAALSPRHSHVLRASRARDTPSNLRTTNPRVAYPFATKSQYPVYRR